MNSSEGWDKTATDYDTQTFTGKFALVLFNKVTKSNIPKGAKMIDIAGGTGQLSLAVARLGNNNISSIVATDFSPKMVEMVRSHVNNEKLSNIIPKVMDGQNLEADDEMYDYAFNSFGLFCFPDIQKGIDEMFRVIKKNGRIGISTWSPRLDPPKIIRAIINRLNPNTTAPVPPLLNSAESIRPYLEKAGFSEIETTLVEGYTEYPSLEEFIEKFKTNPMYVGARNSVPEEVRDKFESTALEVLHEMFPSLPAKMESCPLMTTATKL
eukprot:TRINITY_DN5982_c0_g1_i1.p1 TRINITY_DN5982_c0_g1~~TRINITY_DN5982_c0_g1_i1.p1  ORF type:complete len:267 (+),score=62.95 TRINITY_DN5982_c0_g1_i1:60-860(+)